MEVCIRVRHEALTDELVQKKKQKKIITCPYFIHFTFQIRNGNTFHVILGLRVRKKLESPRK